jgi:hypothetical protein
MERPERTINEKLAVIEETLNRMDEQLFGNGQPGVIEKMSSRISRLEKAFWIAVGGGFVIIWFIERIVE